MTNQDSDQPFSSELKPFSMLHLATIYADSNQHTVVRSLAHLASREVYCNPGAVLLQMTDQELLEVGRVFYASEQELEPYLLGEKTLVQSKNLNSMATFCLLLARLEGEIEIKTGVLQKAFTSFGIMLQQETKYRTTKKNKPDYAKMSVLS
jgi:hypothetical protein